VDRGAGETAYAVRDGGDPHAASNLASITLAPDAQSILVIGTPAVKEVQVTLGPWSARTDKPADQYSLTDGQVQGQVTVFRLHPISMAAEQLMQVFVRFAGAIHTDDYATYNWRLIPAAPLTRATLPPSRARPHILFVSGDSAGDSVLTILSEGRTHTLLRAPDHGVIDYSVSPDYRRVAVVISRANQWDIVVVNLDGTGTTMLTDDSALEQRPTWSPDGQTLAFVSTADPDTHCIQHTCYSDIYTINADGTNRRQLTTDPDADREPAWSPDGTHIAFLRGCVDIVKECTQVLYLMQADGRNQTSVLDAAGAPIREAFASTPSWSSDGQHIVVYIYRYGENGAFAIPVAGGLPIKLHAFIWTEGHATIYEYGFRRSADGARIAFIRQTGECQVEPCIRHIYVMNADGSSKRQLTYDGTENTSPAWSPDEQQILFVSNREGTWGIYTMDADGNHQQQLVQNVDGFSQPLWLP
jgi:Tol biopolymer transport system component